MATSSLPIQVMHEPISEQLYEHGIMKPGAYRSEDLLTVLQNRIGEMKLLFDLWGGPEADAALERIRVITSRDRDDLFNPDQAVNTEEIRELVALIDRAWFGGQLERRIYLSPRHSLLSVESCLHKAELFSLPSSLDFSERTLHGIIEFETYLMSYKYPFRWQRRAMIKKSLITAMVTMYFKIFRCRCDECQDPVKLIHTTGLSGEGKFWSTAVSLMHQSFKSEIGHQFPYDLGAENSLQSIISRAMRLEMMEQKKLSQVLGQERKSNAYASHSSDC